MDFTAAMAAIGLAARWTSRAAPEQHSGARLTQRIRLRVADSPEAPGAAGRRQGGSRAGARR